LASSAFALILAIALPVPESAAASRAGAPFAQEGVMMPPQMFFQISGSCSTEISPDQAVIVGGVSASGLQPTDAVDQLEKQLAAMRAFIAEKKGTLELQERVRTLKNPQPNNRSDNEPPFQVVQRLRATFPADAPVDAILQKLIELGLDRFGDNVLNNYNRREVVIRYHASGLDAKLKKLEQDCTADAWKKWAASPNATKDEATEPPPASLELQFFNAHSKESLMRPDGITQPWQFNVGRGQPLPDAPELMGNVTVHLEGAIAYSYRREPPKP
jgi:hypothetical protein